MLSSGSPKASQANEMVEMGVFNSWVILLMKSFLIVLFFFWRMIV